VIVSLRSFKSQRSCRHSINEFVVWYCAAPRLSAGGELEQIQFLFGRASLQATEKYLGGTQRLREAVNDQIGIERGSKLVPLTANSAG